jgi:hypothetical protein
MSTTDDPDQPPHDRPTVDPKRSRQLIAGVVLGAVVFVIGFMLLVSQCGTGGDDEIYGQIYGQGAVPPLARVSIVQ